MNENDGVPIATFVYEIEAASAVLLLKTNGIDSGIRDSAVVNSDPLLSNAVGGIKLYVERKDAEEALKILDEDRIKRDEETGKYCYNCESTDISKIKNKITWKTIIICILTLGLGVPLVFKGFKEYQCNKCGHKW
jgi:hypothetical protein